MMTPTVLAFILTPSSSDNALSSLFLAVENVGAFLRVPRRLVFPARGFQPCSLGWTWLTDGGAPLLRVFRIRNEPGLDLDCGMIPDQINRRIVAPDVDRTNVVNAVPAEMLSDDFLAVLPGLELGRLLARVDDLALGRRVRRSAPIYKVRNGPRTPAITAA